MGADDHLKVVPIGKNFENLKAFLHHIASDEAVVKFAGVVILEDGDMRYVNFKFTRAELAFACLVLQEQAMTY